MSHWIRYHRKGLAEMRPYRPGEDLSGISVSPEDDPPSDMGMIARNPDNHDDKWYVARAYFNKNFERAKTGDGTKPVYYEEASGSGIALRLIHGEIIQRCVNNIEKIHNQVICTHHGFNNGNVTLSTGEQELMHEVTEYLSKTGQSLKFGGYVLTPHYSSYDGGIVLCGLLITELKELDLSERDTLNLNM